MSRWVEHHCMFVPDVITYVSGSGSFSFWDFCGPWRTLFTSSVIPLNHLFKQAKCDWNFQAHSERENSLSGLYQSLDLRIKQRQQHCTVQFRKRKREWGTEDVYSRGKEGGSRKALRLMEMRAASSAQRGSGVGISDCQPLQVDLKCSCRNRKTGRCTSPTFEADKPIRVLITHWIWMSSHWGPRDEDKGYTGLAVTKLARKEKLLSTMSWKLAVKWTEFRYIEYMTAAYHDITDISFNCLPDREEKAT